MARFQAWCNDRRPRGRARCGGEPTGAVRSAVIREAVEEHLAADRDAAIGRAIVDGYRRIPPGTPDEWGDLEGMADAAGRETAHRLDVEERAAGFDRWCTRRDLVVRAP